MTPTEQEIEFFIKHQAFFERLWKPRFGDLVLCWDADNEERDKDAWLVIGKYSEDAVDVIRKRDGAIGPILIVDCVLLPRQGQLWEMIKAQGLKPGLVETSDEKGNPTGVYAFATHPIDGDIFWEADGPTPSIALGRALIEVLKEE